ncbi:Uncharacterised protein [Vibrio cholerae]|uniref:Uncharacterized protein n=1 Tax=Vibrio cholerae TaxID=666 RepID=A0A655WGB4_VIBCL|nr:Uncharacterised protein [Vibrio cholerae]
MLGTGFQIHHRVEVRALKRYLVHLRFKRCHQPGFKEQRYRHLRQLWYPFVNKMPFTVMLLCLLGRVINADGVGARYPCLHLKLRVMNARFKIEKQLRQISHARSPIDIHMMS